MAALGPLFLSMKPLPSSKVSGGWMRKDCEHSMYYVDSSVISMEPDLTRKRLILLHLRNQGGVTLFLCFSFGRFAGVFFCT